MPGDARRAGQRLRRIPQRGREAVAGHDLVVWRDASGLLARADEALWTNVALGVVGFIVIETLLFTAWTLARGRLQRVVAECAIAEVLTRPIGHLSKGYRQRVGLAAALLHRPEILFLDEPTNNLDPDTRKRLIDIIAGLGLAFIIISHDYDFLAATCADLAGMEAGRIVAADHSALHAHHHVHPHGTKPHKHGGH